MRAASKFKSLCQGQHNLLPYYWKRWLTASNDVARTLEHDEFNLAHLAGPATAYERKVRAFSLGPVRRKGLEIQR
jgi:hypothetical protein